MAATPPNTPERIGRYRIVSVLGRGAMGVVYKAHDDSIDRSVAIKTIRPELLEADPTGEWLERFQREARAAGRCQHRGIVAIYELGQEGGAPFLAMEFVDGKPLETVLREQGTLPASRATSVITQVLDALGFAHGQGVVHRDVKPANIMLVNGSSVKVADFGVARLDTLHLTRDGMMVGTPSYMAPEQFTGGAVDHRADLYAAAVLFFEMLTGRRPFEGKTTAELMYQVAHTPPPPVSRVAPDLGARFDALLGRGLARDPDARFQSAGAFVRALGRALEEPAPSESVNQTQVAQPAHQPPPPAPTPMRPAWQAADATMVSTSGLPPPPAPGWPPPPAPGWPPPPAPAWQPQQNAGPAWPPPPAPAWQPSPPPPPILADASARRFVDALAADLGAAIGPGAVSAFARAGAHATTLEELCRALSAEISDPQARQAFIDRATQRMAGHGHQGAAPASPPAPTATTTSMFGQPPPAANISAPVVERATRALAEFLGPIARIHVKSALAAAASDDQFLRTLAGHLDTETERSQFMTKARGR